MDVYFEPAQDLQVLTSLQSLLKIFVNLGFVCLVRPKMMCVGRRRIRAHKLASGVIVGACNFWNVTFICLTLEKFCYPNPSLLLLHTDLIRRQSGVCRHCYVQTENARPGWTDDQSERYKSTIHKRPGLVGETQTSPSCLGPSLTPSSISRIPSCPISVSVHNVTNRATRCKPPLYQRLVSALY